MQYKTKLTYILTHNFCKHAVVSSSVVQANNLRDLAQLFGNRIVQRTFFKIYGVGFLLVVKYSNIEIKAKNF